MCVCGGVCGEYCMAAYSNFSHVRSVKNLLLNYSWGNDNDVIIIHIVLTENIRIYTNTNKDKNAQTYINK